MKKQPKPKPYVQWIHPDDDFVIPTGYTCIPPAIGHLDEKCALFKTPSTPEEMAVAISIEEKHILDTLDFVANCETADPKVRIKLMLELARRDMKHIGQLYERKGELKFVPRANELKAIAIHTNEIVVAKGKKELRIALRKSVGGKKGANAAELTKSDQEQFDRTNIMTDFNARLRKNHKLYKHNDNGYKSVDRIAKETASSHLGENGKPLMSWGAIKQEHYRRKKRKG